MRIGSMLAALGVIAGGIATVPAAHAEASTYAGTGAAIIPVQPNQAFRGLVNGEHDNAVIRVGCLGPVSPGQTGHPVAGQTIEVGLGTTTTKGGGYTGSAGTAIVTALSPISTGMPIVFKAYNVPQAIPTSMSLPCYGTRTIPFVPEPTSDSAVTDDVTVTFVGIGP